MINILNIGFSNAVSIGNTLEDLEYPYKLITKKSELQDGILILPGVGSIGNFKKDMNKANWEEFIIDYHKSGNKLIGICLGFQALTKFSEESGGTKCMNILKKDIQTNYFDKVKRKSHTSWKNFSISKNFLEINNWTPTYKRSKKKSLSGRVFYNHSFAVEHKSKSSIQISGHNNFSGLIVNKNVMGIQFHPEKSQNFGKELFRFIL